MINLMATFLITCAVTIGSLKFDRANEIKIKTSWKELADTCGIKLPLLKGKLVHGTANESLADKINQGDRVDIKLGWIGMNKTYEYDEFKGFVRRVSPNIPMEVECEDAVYLLRQVNLSKAWRNTTLKEVVNYIVSETNTKFKGKYSIQLSAKIPDVSFDKFRLDNVNGAEALDQLKQEFGFVAFFRDMELYVGLAFIPDAGTVKFSLAYNVASSDLTYRKAEDTRIRLKAVSILKDNKKIEVEIGPEDGEQRTQFYYNITDKVSLKKLAEKDIDKLRFEGYEGSIKSLLVPFVSHSMSATILDPEYEVRNGSYMVDSVETTFGRGIDRTVTLGKKLS